MPEASNAPDRRNKHHPHLQRKPERAPCHQGAHMSPRVIHMTVSDTDIAMMRRMERYILAYDGDNLLHDLDLHFPGASYRPFFLAYGRARGAARWMEPEGCA
jgi:hypothetical protein